MAAALAGSMVRTAAPRYGLIVTRPAPARVFSASRTGVLDTPSIWASSVSTRLCPGRSSPARMARLMASRTASVREGVAPVVPLRKLRAGGTMAVLTGIPGQPALAYGISYMT